MDLPNFYANPPKDLKALLPVRFNTKNKEFRVSLPEINNMNKKKPVIFRNYYYGSPEGWDAKAYKGLFPNVKSGSDISHYTRILNQSIGKRSRLIYIKLEYALLMILHTRHCR